MKVKNMCMVVFAQTQELQVNLNEMPQTWSPFGYACQKVTIFMKWILRRAFRALPNNIYALNDVVGSVLTASQRLTDKSFLQIKFG